MAIHDSIPSMLQESLQEMLLVAKYCIEFRKKVPPWPYPGCYGYPATLILLSIADGIGSYVEQGKVENHFKILNNQNYYNLDLDKRTLRAIYDYYRNTLSHNAVLAPNVVLDIGQPTENVIEKINGSYLLKLVPLYNISTVAVNIFLNNPAVLVNNKTINIIQRKSEFI